MMLQLKQHDNKALNEAYSQLKRAMDAFGGRPPGA
jgi:hypothetical protein